jgi:phage-related protein
VLLLPAALGAFGAAVGTAKLALSGFDVVMKALAKGDVEAFNKALEKLAPSAQNVAKAIKSLKPAFDALRIDVQQRAFSQLAPVVQKLGLSYFPTLRAALGGIATGFNQAALSLGKFLNNTTVARELDAAMGAIRVGVVRATQALVPFAKAFEDIFVVGAQFLPRFGSAIDSLANKFANFINQARESGQLKQSIEDSITASKQLGQVLANVGGILSGVFRAAQTESGGFLNNLVEVTAKIKEVVNSSAGQNSLREFFASAREAAAALSPAIAPLLGLLSQVGQSLTAVGKALAPALVPLINGLTAGVQALTPGAVALAEGFGKVVTALSPLLQGIGQLIGVIGTQLGAALGALASAVAPIVQSLSAGMTVLAPAVVDLASGFARLSPLLPRCFSSSGNWPAWSRVPSVMHSPPIAPAISSVVNTLSTALGPILNVLATAFSQVVTALEPLAFAFAQVANTVITALAPAFLSIVQTVGGAVSGAFTTLAGVLVQATPAIQQIAQAFGLIFQQIAGALGAVLPPLITVFGQLVTALAPLASILATTFRDVVGAFLPVIQQAVTVFGQLAEAVGGILTQALEAIKPVLPVIAQAFTDILSAVQPVIAVLGPALGSIFAALAPVIASLAQAFASVAVAVAPVVSALVSGLTPIITALAPVIAQVGQIIAGCWLPQFKLSPR